jgi:hypothetical protein
MLLALGLCCAIWAVCAGCGEAVVEAKVEVEVAPLPAPMGVPAQEVNQDKTSAEAQELSGSEEESKETPKETPQEEPAQTTFVPRFPDRVELFQPPKRQNKGLANAQGQQRTIVELLGFANVDRQFALIAVDGLVAPVAEGGEYSGIEVIKIQPPTVFLRRGRERWQTALTY